jgi:phosphoribosylamine--glycine ligase
MLTRDGPRVLEFNARFGDPETQALVPRLAGDWLALLHAAATGGVDSVQSSFTDQAAVCVVLASAGYPGSYATGRVISGLDEAERLAGVHVFHAGTVRRDGHWLTAGGRVLGVTAIAGDITAARDRAYAAVARIGFDGEHHRRDIAADAAACGRRG